MTRLEVLERIKVCEKEGKFDEHVDPIDYDNCYPVDENFHYIKKGFKEILMNFIYHTFVVLPFTRRINKEYKTEFIGRENLKGIKGAILTCNHVNKFDCLVAKKGVKHHKLFITAAPFNNQKGKFGDFMRAGGMMPFPSCHRGLKNFNDAMEKRLKDNFVMFYPEQSMWWNYEKVRPFKNGAFHYAVKYNVPVIPLFITYIDLNEMEDGVKKKKFFLHILKPIYPKKELTAKENVEYLRDTDYKMCVDVYEKFYQEKMVYTTEVKEC